MVILEQVSVNPRAPVPTFARRKRRAHEYLQLAVALRTCRFRPPLPGVEPAARHAQTPAEQLERVVCLLRRDEAKLHRRSFAKKAAAFFRISRSSRRIRFSFRRRASSSRSAVVRPVLPCVRSARARLTQARSAVSVRSRSRAARPTLLPSSSTSRTAWALKSSSNCRRGRRRLGVSAIARDIVSTFRKMSTKPDQAHRQCEWRYVVSSLGPPDHLVQREPDIRVADPFRRLRLCEYQWPIKLGVLRLLQKLGSVPRFSGCEPYSV